MRDVLGQFKLPAVLLQIGGFEAAQVLLELFTRKQSFFQAVPVAEIDVAAVPQAQLEAEASLNPRRT
jgi:hypothetical protein